MKIALLFLCFLSCLQLHAQVTDTIPVQFGDSTLSIIITKFQPTTKGIYFINVHSNETTSIEAGRAYCFIHGGTLLQLNHGLFRNISFSKANTIYSFDPNRMFSKIGIKNSLKKFSTYHRAAVNSIVSFANTLLQQMPEAKLIIALHNNTDGDYSIDSYSPGHDEAPNTLKLYINNEMDADDFVYTTEEKIFDYLKEKKINVVLQDNIHCVDDGSLSVYCGKHHIPYINIESQEGHRRPQLEIIDALNEMIQSYN